MLKDFVTAVDTAVVCEHTLSANGGRRSDEVHFSAASARILAPHRPGAKSVMARYHLNE
jgi:hypothetical protein